MTASMTVAYVKTVTINPADTYWQNRIATATSLVKAGFPRAEYVTQFASGGCEWAMRGGRTIVISPNDSVAQVCQMASKA